MRLIAAGRTGCRSLVSLQHLGALASGGHARSIVSSAEVSTTTEQLGAVRAVKDHRKVIVITGPTAVGKTKVSLEIAKRLGGEIISADSVQVCLLHHTSKWGCVLDLLRLSVRQLAIGTLADLFHGHAG